MCSCSLLNGCGVRTTLKIMEIDTYRIAAYVAGCKAAHVHNSTDPSASNAYALFLAAQEDLDNAKVPQGGRFAIVKPAFLNFLKQNDNFIKQSDMSQEIAISGVVGEVDGVMIVKAPASYFPEGIHCILTNYMVMPSPVKLQDYKIHQDPPGINGWLVEGRIRYDAFILDEKADAISVIANSGASTGDSVTVSPSTASVAVGGTVTLTAQTLPANRAVTWTSSDATKATVANGVVTGVGAGSATITATATINGSTYTDTCKYTEGYYHQAYEQKRKKFLHYIFLHMNNIADISAKPTLLYRKRARYSIAFVVFAPIYYIQCLALYSILL